MSCRALLEMAAFAERIYCLACHLGLLTALRRLKREKAHAGDHQRIDYSYENLPVIGSEKKIAGLATFFSLFF